MEYIKLYSDATGTIASYFINVFLLIAVFDGVRRISASSITKSSVLLTFFGILFCFGKSASSFYIAHNFEEIMQYEPNFVEFPEDWGIDLPTQKRSEITIIPAQLYFKNTGDYAHHVGKDGSWKVFIPTPKDIKQREEEIIGKERIRYLISRNNSIGWYWLVSVLIAATMGWIAAHNKYSKTFGFNS